MCLDCSMATRYELGVKHRMTERTLAMLKAVLKIISLSNSAFYLYVTLARIQYT